MRIFSKSSCVTKHQRKEKFKECAKRLRNHNYVCLVDGCAQTFITAFELKQHECAKHQTGPLLKCPRCTVEFMTCIGFNDPKFHPCINAD